MKFGIHSLLFHETFLEKDLPLLDKVKQMGFDAIEIIPFDPDGFPAAKVKRVAAEIGLTVNTGFGLPAEYNIISPDPAVRRRSSSRPRSTRPSPGRACAPRTARASSTRRSTS